MTSYLFISQAGTASQTYCTRYINLPSSPSPMLATFLHTHTHAHIHSHILANTDTHTQTHAHKYARTQASQLKFGNSIPRWACITFGKLCPGCNAAKPRRREITSTHTPGHAQTRARAQPTHQPTLPPTHRSPSNLPHPHLTFAGRRQLGTLPSSPMGLALVGRSRMCPPPYSTNLF